MLLSLRLETPAGCAGSAAKKISAAIVEVMVEVSSPHRVSDLADALAAHCGLHGHHLIEICRTGRVPRAGRRVDEVDLVSGDRIRLKPVHGMPERVARSMPDDDRDDDIVRLDVLGGPDVGRSFRLANGVYRVGRDRTDPIRVRDPYTPRRALDVRVGLDTVTIEPLRSEVCVNGSQVEGEVDVSPHDVIELGANLVAVRNLAATSGNDGGRYRTTDGVVAFHRTPTALAPIPDPGLGAFGPIPDQRPPRRLGLLSILAPLIAGLGLFAITGRAMFLLFTAMSPLLAIARFIEDRRSGAKKLREEVADFREALGVRVTELQHAADVERCMRLDRAPDLFEIERRIERRSASLWCRQRDTEEFGRLRLGLGSVQATFEADIVSGGDDNYRQEARDALAGLGRLHDAPVTIDMAPGTVVGIHQAEGDDGVVADSTASSLLLQAAALHSPKDLRIAVISSPVRPLSWAKWLPHLADGAGIPRWFALGAEDGQRLIGELVVLARHRAEETNGGSAWPNILVMIDGDLDLDAADCDRLVQLGASAGISVIWLASSLHGITRHASTLVEVLATDAGPMGRRWETRTASESEFKASTVSDGRALAMAHSLCPLRDATSAAVAGGIPDLVPTFDLFGDALVTAATSGAADLSAHVLDRWRSSDRSGLHSPIGIGRDGLVMLDLVKQGPHTLIGGTSGAGKSELIQSIVVGLAVEQPPQHVNFLFVDYKGGASSQMFAGLPHTVGLVTNLDESMARRALESLRAELNHRMRLLEGRAKDLDELARIDPGAPPSLVIICDEFATLIKEIPDFVAGIVDIAQRGRSLGVHLVLATQRPSGAVNDNILANTNLRIALRTLDKSESHSIIGEAAASEISPDHRGRLFMCAGAGSPVEVQCGFTGAPSSEGKAEPIVIYPLLDGGVGPGVVYRLSADTADKAGGSDDEIPAQLDVLVDAIVDADELSGHGDVRRPWREPLPAVVDLADLDTAPRAASELVVGLADRPDLQDQFPITEDIADTGGMIVFGSTGSGKTTFVRSTIASAACEVVVVDGSSRLLLEAVEFANVAEVFKGDDAEGLTRLVVALERELSVRRHATEELSPVLLVIDEWATVVGTLLEVGNAADGWPERLEGAIIDGRSLGIHTVITAERSNDVRARLQSALGSRLIFRHSDSTHYSSYGIPSDISRGLQLPVGRALIGATTLVQTGVLGGNPETQIEALVGAARTRGSAQVPRTIMSQPLPRQTRLSPLRAAGDGAGDAAGRRNPLSDIEIGLADVTGTRVNVDIVTSDLAIVGHPVTGRSTALATLTEGVARGGSRVVVIGTDYSGVRDMIDDALGDVHAAFGEEEVLSLLDRLDLAGEAAIEQPTVIAIDDLEQQPDSVCRAVDNLGRSVRLIVATDYRSVAGYSPNPVANRIKQARRMLVLRPDDPSEAGQVTGMRVRLRPGVSMVPGRALLMVDRRYSLIQVAVPSTWSPTPTPMADHAVAI